MSALNLIIARGFGPEIKELGTAYGDARNAQIHANDVSAANRTNIANAQQDQQFQIEDRQVAEQGRIAGQQQQQELQELLGAVSIVDQRLRANPDDQEARAAAVEISARLSALAPKAAPTVSGILGLTPKPQSSAAKPVIVMGPNGPVYADAQSAVGQPAYIRPSSPQTLVMPSYTPTQVQNPDGTVSQVFVNTKNPSEQVTVGKAPAKQNTKASDAQTSQRTYDAFSLSVGNVEKAFSKTDTGPIVGRMPAYTADQQIAEGAVAAMAPILKQLFRSAGEGVFTDKDQQLLTDMAPKRTDRPEAAAAKITAIKDIVAAKLGITAAPVQQGQKSYKTASGATVEILD